MTRGSIIWGNDELTRAPYAPDAKHIRRDINYPTAEFQVGQREGRLSERSSAGRSWAARADWKHAVQGDQLSHSFRRPFLLQFAIDVAAVLVAFTLILATGFGLGFAVFAVLFL